MSNLNLLPNQLERLTKLTEAYQRELKMNLKVIGLDQLDASELISCEDYIGLQDHPKSSDIDNDHIEITWGHNKSRPLVLLFPFRNMAFLNTTKANSSYDFDERLRWVLEKRGYIIRYKEPEIENHGDLSLQKIIESFYK